MSAPTAQVSASEPEIVSACSCGRPAGDCPADKAVQLELDAAQISVWMAEGHAIDSRLHGTDWVHVPVEHKSAKPGTWALYRPKPDTDLLEPTDVHGTWDNGDPGVLAAIKLSDCAPGEPTWVVNVYGPDEQLLAWAEWQGNVVAVRRAPAKPVKR